MLQDPGFRSEQSTVLMRGHGGLAGVAEEEGMSGRRGAAGSGLASHAEPALRAGCWRMTGASGGLWGEGLALRREGGRGEARNGCGGPCGIFRPTVADHGLGYCLSKYAIHVAEVEVRVHSWRELLAGYKL